MKVGKVQFSKACNHPEGKNSNLLFDTTQQSPQADRIRQGLCSLSLGSVRELIHLGEKQFNSERKERRNSEVPNLHLLKRSKTIQIQVQFLLACNTTLAPLPHEPPAK